jgi:hypothetical protein
MANPELMRDPSQPDLYGDMEQKIASQKIIKQQELSDLLNQALGRNKEVSPTQAFAASALALLPILVGKHYAGTQGAAIGAGVASKTAPQYAQTLGQPDPEEVAIAESRAKVKQGEIDALTKQESSIMTNRLQGQREMARDERLYGPGGVREQFEIRKEIRNPRGTSEKEERSPEEVRVLIKIKNGEKLTPEEEVIYAKTAPYSALTPPKPQSGRPSFLGQMPAELATRVVRSYAVAGEVEAVANRLDKLPEQSIAQLIAAGALSAADNEQIMQQANMVLQEVMRADSGMTVREDEQADLKKIVVGDKSVTSRRMAQIMRNYVQQKMAINTRVVEGTKNPDNMYKNMRRMAGLAESANSERGFFIEEMAKSKKPDGSDYTEEELNDLAEQLYPE